MTGAHRTGGPYTAQPTGATVLDLAAGALTIAAAAGLAIRRTDPLIAFRLGYWIGRRRRLHTRGTP